MTLTKADLADRLYEELGLNKRESKEFVELLGKHPGLEETQKRAKKFPFLLVAW
jgi:nucleoid DNA-binding protein